MAKNKGKAQRRIKDWHRRTVAAGDADDSQAPRRQSFAKREVKLPADREESGVEGLEDLPRAEGMVVGFYPGGVVVRSGGEDVLCSVAKTFRAPEGSSPLAIGDTVAIAVTRKDSHGDDERIDRDRADAMVLSRDLRETVLARPQPRSAKRTDQYDTGGTEKVIAANIDCLGIVTATRRPQMRHGLIDRFLIIAERGELEPILVINKIDLAPPNAEVLADFAALEIPIVLCSAEGRQGLDDLIAALAGRRSVLAGASGVGKTSLINAIIPEVDAKTRSVRSKDDRGRHTTSAASIYELLGGGMIIDTPGIRELALGLTVEELPWYFPEIEAAAPRCKFNDCSHTHEPHCAVLAAVESGEIPARRYDSYLRILETIEDAR